MADYISIRARWARELVRLQVSAELQKLNAGGPNSRMAPLVPSISDPSPNQLPPDTRFEAAQGSLPEGAKVCIIGAGAAGLYLAMLLDSIGIKYDLFEASDRVGGRMFTHHFSKADHDYYDIGAMRYPNIYVMQRTFDLFTRLNLPLIQYFYSGDEVVNVPSRFNDINDITNATPPRLQSTNDPDVYRVSVSNGGSVPDQTIQDGVDHILDDAFGRFKEGLLKDWDTGFQELIQQDKYSTRQYLREVKGYDFYSIQWMETQNTSSGLFDQAFVESVIDSFDFDTPQGAPAPPIPGGKPWYCILGGTTLLAEKMEASIADPIKTGKRVTRVWIDRDSKEAANMYVQVAGEAQPRAPYVTVLNTTTLGCLQRMDLTGLDLHPSTKDAIRCLHYDNSCKVAIRFTYPWWIKECGITSGGIASTDLPLRTCVYPSYNLKDESSAVLLCSYTWAQDAVRAGSLISRDSPKGEDELKEVMIDNLAKLHLNNFGGKTLVEVREIIAGAYDTHHAWAWTHDPHMSGAFALFGPGQFDNFYTYLTRPAADAKFHIVGEASSAHHAWIAGSLDSAAAACLKFLSRYDLWKETRQLKDEWGTVDEYEDGKHGTAHLQKILGMLEAGDHVQVAPAARLSERFMKMK